MKNVGTFAAYKAYHCTQMIKRQVADENGVVRSKKEIEENANKVLKIFNRWQSAEYNTAVARTRTGKQFSIFNEPENLDAYKNIRWIPSRSVKQRDVHKPFYNLVLPKDHPFWQSNQPGNLWNCKCDWEQTSDNVSTVIPKTNIQSKGLEGNPATTGEIFTSNSSYISKCSSVEKQQIEDWYKKYHSSNESNKKNQPTPKTPEANQSPVTTPEELTSFFKELNKDTNWFENGFKKIGVTHDRTLNGSTDRRGHILLSPNILKHCIDGLNNIKKGINTTFDQEVAFGTLWHEITHNRHKSLSDTAGDKRSQSRQFMELANEFIARKTLPEFYKALGVEMNYPQLMEDRDACGYNDPVIKYQNLIKRNNLDLNVVINEVGSFLFEKPYDKQLTGLSLGIVTALEKIRIENGGKSFNKKEKKTYFLEAEKIIKKMIN